MARNHLWRYTLHLFHTFAIFEKIFKIDARRDPANLVFSFKSEPWAHQGRLGLPFGLIFEASKNRWFFDVALGLRKICKNRSLEQPGVAQPTSTHGFGGSGVPGRRPIIKEIDETITKTTRCVVWHAVGPLARRIDKPVTSKKRIPPHVNKTTFTECTIQMKSQFWIVHSTTLVFVTYGPDI